MKLNKVCLLLGLMILFGTSGWSQIKSFKYQSDILKIDSTGVYRIELSPDIIAKSKDDLFDMRITDNTGKFIAYTLSNRLLLNYKEHFIVFPEVISNSITDTLTTFIAENNERLVINKLWLKIKNTEVNRTVNLTGSDDLKNWFAIKEDIPLDEAEQGSGTDYTQALSFPNSNYRYFKIQFNGKNKTPVKIIQIGVSTTGIDQPMYTVLPNVKFLEKDTNKISHILITLDQAYQINKIHLGVSSPKYYNRRVVVYGVKGNNANQLTDTVISSGGSQDLLFYAKTKQLRVDIFNEDDNALVINSVTPFQLKEYLISYLEKGKNYKLYTGNDTLQKPSYDLSFLNKVAFNQLTGIKPLAVVNNPAYLGPIKPTVKNHTVLLWLSIIIALIILSVLTVKMMKEIK